MAIRTNEIQATVNSIICNSFSNQLRFGIQIVFIFSLNKLSDWLPTVINANTFNIFANIHKKKQFTSTKFLRLENIMKAM